MGRYRVGRYGALVVLCCTGTPCEGHIIGIYLRSVIQGRYIGLVGALPVWAGMYRVGLMLLIVDGLTL